MTTMFPRQDPVPASLRKELNLLREQVEQLSAIVRRIPIPEEREYVEHEIIFSYAGQPVENETSPIYHIRAHMAYVVEARLSFGKTEGSAAGSTCVVEVLNNGSVVETLEYSYDEERSLHFLDDGLMTELEEWDRLAVRVQAITPNLTDLTVQLMLLIPARGE